MTCIFRRSPRQAACLAVVLGISGILPVAGQEQAPAQPPAAPLAQPAPQAQSAAAFVESRSARETRQQLEQLLREYPPSVSQVLRLDPSLLRQPGYLVTYPGLQAFIGQHPEIERNPAFFFGQAGLPDFDQSPETRAIRMWENLFEGLTVLAGLMALLGAIVWLLRSIMEHRRWLRTSRVQVEAHSKLLDRFTSNAELLTYIETSPGRRFLEAAPLTLDSGARAMAAPFGRILWSVQAGLVLAMAGGGLLFVSTRVIEEVGQGLYVIGMVVLSLGVGFVLSSAAAYGLSHRLGLLEPPPPPTEVS